MKVRIQRLIEDGEVAGYLVDLDDAPVEDTSSRFFGPRREEQARDFADEVAALLITEVVQAEDDVL